VFVLELTIKAILLIYNYLGARWTLGSSDMSDPLRGTTLQDFPPIGPEARMRCPSNVQIQISHTDQNPAHPLKHTG
jgi:hypothetical protein